MALWAGVLSLMLCADIPKAIAQKADVSGCVSARREFKKLNRPLLILNDEDADRSDSLGTKNYSDALRIGTKSLENYLTKTTLEQLDAGLSANELSTFLSCMLGDEQDKLSSDYTNAPAAFLGQSAGTELAVTGVLIVRGSMGIPDTKRFSSVLRDTMTGGHLSARRGTTTEARLSSSILCGRPSKVKYGFY